jgi:prepilin-type N-terminal cleavage/methylation domain-containing protein
MGIVHSPMHMKQTSPPWSNRHACPAAASRTQCALAGFTLVELLVVITIILTLAALTFGVVVKTRQRADNVLAISNMRQIGAAIASYMTENDHLPTFRDVGVSPAYSTNDPYTQASVLQPYLGIPELTSKTQYALIFRPPGLKPDNMSGQKNWHEVTSYAMYHNEYITPSKAYLPKGVVTDSEGQDVGPFGRYTGGGTPVDGWRSAQLDAALTRFTAENGGKIATLSKAPAMFEINAEYPSAKGSWPWPVPEKTLRQDHVNVLYFDWRVESVTPKFFFTP